MRTYKGNGGSDGIRDDNLLQAALLSPLQTYNSVELFPSTIEKAVRLACGLTQNHPFIDGNKRIGAHAMLVTLKLNGISLSFTQQELSGIFLRLAASEISFAELNVWVHSHLSVQKNLNFLRVQKTRRLQSPRFQIPNHFLFSVRSLELLCSNTRNCDFAILFSCFNLSSCDTFCSIKIAL